MQKYKYVAVNLQNHKIKGTFIAKDEKDLAEQLAKQSLYLVSASIYSGGTPNAFFTLGTGKVSISELNTFSRQFSIMLNTHIPLLDCLDILKNQSYTSYFKKILDVIYDDVKGGLLLSEALKKHKSVFPEFFRSMIYVGEMSGKLDMVFNALADYYENDEKQRRKLMGAMAYPLMLLGLTIGLVVIMLGFVVPTFRESLSQLEIDVEGTLTGVIYDISDFILEWWQLIVAAVIIIGIIIFGVLQTERGKYVRDMLALSVPLIKTININSITSRFARAFSLLLSSGMDLNDAMDAVEVILSNRYLKAKFHIAADYVRHGMSLTNAFETGRLFPNMMIKMISVGERTNSLDEVLTRSCNFFDTQVETSIASFTSKISPIMLIIMGVVVATLFIAVYSPMLTIMGGLGV